MLTDVLAYYKQTTNIEIRMLSEATKKMGKMCFQAFQL